MQISFDSPLFIWLVNSLFLVAFTLFNIYYSRRMAETKSIKRELARKVEKLDCEKTHDVITCWRRELIEVNEARQHSINRIEKALVWIVTQMNGKPSEIGLMD
jgi:hypothetical protein